MFAENYQIQNANNLEQYQKMYCLYCKGQEYLCLDLTFTGFF